MLWKQVVVVVVGSTAFLISDTRGQCSETVKAGTDCSLTPDCCPTGQQCFRKNQYWAGCLPSCEVGMLDDFDSSPWECTVVTKGSDDPGQGEGDGEGDGEIPLTCSELLAQEMPAGTSTRGFVEKHGKLKLNGVQLVDEQGAAIQLRGMSSHGIHWFDDCYSKESVEFLVEKWGITVFRAAMYIGEGGYATDIAGNKAKVLDIVRWCEELGIYVIIDWHVLTPGDPNAWLSQPGASSGLAIDFWKEMASTYVEKKHVLYEIANEPNNIDWPSVKAYHDAVIGAIRSIDTETVILAGTTTWSQDIHLAAADPVANPYNVMYSFHFYAGTHIDLLERVEAYSTKIPIFVTEWGTSQASGDGGPYLSNTKTFLQAFSSGGVLISWVQWSFADKAEVSAALAPGACATKSWEQTTCSGTFLRRVLIASASEDGQVNYGESSATLFTCSQFLLVALLHFAYV